MQILIVEDELSLAASLEHILQTDGNRTDCVHDGQTALDYVRGAEYDLVLLDGMLPRLDGFEVVRAMRQERIHTPVLMLTARTTVPDKVEGLNAGADDYMTKPFDPAELLARVHAMTRRTGEVVMDELRFADLRLELESARLCCGAAAVQLSRRELEVARLLLTNPTQTLTKEQILVRVWGADSDATDNNVEAYISFLRKKLRYLKSTVAIRTVQRIGYRLEDGR